MTTTPDNLFSMLRDMGFVVRIYWSITDPKTTSGTAREGTLSRYKACLKRGPDVVAVCGTIYAVGDRTFVNGRIHAAGAAQRLVLDTLPNSVSNLGEHLESLRVVSDSLQRLNNS